MRKLVLYLGMLFLLLASSFGGFVAGEKTTETKFLTAIEQQAVIGISRNLTLLDKLGETVTQTVRAEIDLNTYAHVISVMKYASNSDLLHTEYRKKTLSKLATVWQKYPPFQDDSMLMAQKIDSELSQSITKSVAYVLQNK
jgi:hypothetical protein